MWSSKHLKFGFIFLLTFSLTKANFQKDEYCRLDLCRDENKHIACTNANEIDSSCAETSQFINLTSYKDELVARHNYYRNQVASGEVDGFPSAERMATITWDDELAYLASLNVMTCKFGHDPCHNTINYKFSGQNLGRWSSSPALNVTEAINRNIKTWFHEFQNTDKSVIKKFFNSPDKKKPHGHFTIMVADKNIKIGCATLKTERPDKMTQYTTACNYATTNLIGLPIYKPGTPTKGCKTGPNPKYAALCSENEEYDLDE